MHLNMICAQSNNTICSMGLWLLLFVAYKSFYTLMFFFVNEYDTNGHNSWL